MNAYRIQVDYHDRDSDDHFQKQVTVCAADEASACDYALSDPRLQIMPGLYARTARVLFQFV